MGFRMNSVKEREENETRELFGRLFVIVDARESMASRVPIVPICPELRDFPGCGTFGAETGTELGKLGRLITLNHKGKC